jgi:hypothetical protein
MKLTKWTKRELSRIKIVQTRNRYFRVEYVIGDEHWSILDIKNGVIRWYHDASIGWRSWLVREEGEVVGHEPMKMWWADKYGGLYPKRKLIRADRLIRKVMMRRFMFRDPLAAQTYGGVGNKTMIMPIGGRI